MCDSHGIVFDTQTSETVCSSCGIVLHNSKESFDPEWRKYAEDAQALVEDPWAKADELASSIGFEQMQQMIVAFVLFVFFHI